MSQKLIRAYKVETDDELNVYFYYKCERCGGDRVYHYGPSMYSSLYCGKCKDEMNKEKLKDREKNNRIKYYSKSFNELKRTVKKKLNDSEDIPIKYVPMFNKYINDAIEEIMDKLNN